MPFSNAKDSCYPKVKVSAFQVTRTPYRGLVITARNGRRCTQHCLAWGALALCCAVAITASPVSTTWCTRTLTGNTHRRTIVAKSTPVLHDVEGPLPAILLCKRRHINEARKWGWVAMPDKHWVMLSLHLATILFCKLTKTFVVKTSYSHWIVATCKLSITQFLHALLQCVLLAPTGRQAEPVPSINYKQSLDAFM